MRKEIRKKDIAIVGLSGRFHEAKNVNEFWENLVNEKEMLYSYSKDELLEYGITESTLSNPNYIPVESIAKDADSFDYTFFGYTKEEADLMDPQIRVLHELVWHALEDAACEPTKNNEKIGLYLSASNNLNWLAHVEMSSSQNINPFYLSQISNKDFISTLISYNLNLQGPSYYSATACSSSLTSVHLACRSLLMRECSVAVAGGVSLDTSTQKGYFYSEGMISSKDGHCKPFDFDSSGSVKGNGGGIVVLKRMEDAIRDKNNIYAIIRSSAINNDGKRKVGYTAPSVNGQADCISMAHQIADVCPTSISYVETHGTGTKLGDSIEIKALNKSFKNDKSHKCAIGSVKSNLGHLDAAAGVAGLIKTSLALKYRKIPATLHFTNPNPEIEFSNGPFYINTKLENWERKDTPLRAGVSSFGVGGTNVHVVLEENIPELSKRKSKPFQILPFSAKTETSLNNYSFQLQRYLNEQEENDIADIAFTLAKRKNVFKYRSFALCDNDKRTESLIGTHHLKNYFINDTNFNIVFMFPGQGNQYYQMAKEIYLTEPYFKSIIDEGLRILNKITGEKFEEFLGYIDSIDLEIQNRINITLYTQPLLFLIEYGLAKLLIQLGVKPTHMIGHSVGEYTAACISEVFTLSDTLRILVKRAKLMNSLEPGLMVAVGMSKEDVISLISEKISIAAVNTKDSCVISGPVEPVKEVIKVLEKLKISFSILNTSHAFHSGMMDEILNEFEKILNEISFSKPKLPFISNLTGKPISDVQAISASYWVSHLRETVKFSQGVENLKNLTNSIFIEVGPGKSLTTFLKQNLKTEIVAINTLRHPKETINDSFYFTKAIGEMWANGIDINWDQYYLDENRYLRSVPGYCFDKYELSFKVDPYSHLRKIKNLTNDSSNWIYLKNWKKATLNTKETKFNKGYIIFSNQDGLCNKLSEELVKDSKVVQVFNADEFENQNNSLFFINSGKKEDYFKLFENLKKEKIFCDNIIFNWELNGESQEEIKNSFDILLNISRELIEYFPNQEKKISIISNFNYDILGNEIININAVTVKTIAKICSQENSKITFSSIDIGSEKIDRYLLDNIKNEVVYNSNVLNVAYRNKKRWVDFYENIETLNESTKPLLDNNKVYLITGGLGYLGSTLASHLIRKYNAKVILTGTSSLPNENLWQNYLEDDTINETLKSRIKVLKDLKSINSDLVDYYQMNVSNQISVKDVLANINSKHGKISGIIHTAGITDKKTFKLIENINEEDIIKQFEPKIKGTSNLFQIFKEQDLDFMWISSSLASILGGLSYGAYATANKFIDAFVESHKNEFRNLVCVNLDGLGEGLIGSKEIVDIFEKTHKANFTNQFIISSKNPNQIILDKNLSKEFGMKEMKKPQISLSKNYLPPNTDTEKKLAEIWESFFGLDKISVNENFFEIGGDSLKAMTLIKRIHKEFNVEVNLLDFFSKPSIKELAEEIEIALMLSKSTNNQKNNLIKI